MYSRFLAAFLLSLVLTGCGLSHNSRSIISGKDAPQHTVALRWNPSSSSIKGYNVYRGVDPGGPHPRIASLVPINSYKDNWVSFGQTYYYVVTAVALNSAESGYSNEAVAFVPEKPTK